jgi:two-component system phosphate regulon sensor histidine kinase PhoR
MENHGSRPEVQGAFARGLGSHVRRSATAGEAYVYVARRMQDEAGRPYALRAAQPLGELAALRRHLLRLLAFSALGGLAAVVVVSWWLDRRLFRPVSDLVAGAQRLARGELSHRLAVPAEEELADLAVSLNRLAERVQEQVAAVEAQRSHLEVVGASMAEGILVTDASGRALMVNPSFRRLFRVKGDVVGKTALELTRVPKLEDLVGQALAGQPGQAEIALQGAAEHAVVVSSSLLRDHSGAVLAARDVSDLVRLGEIRRDLVANVAHELKTPLAAIRGYAETLRDGALDEPETARRFVDRIVQQCQRLQALLADLLTLSQLEREQERPTEPVHLARVIEETVEVLEGAARERHVVVERDLASLPPLAGEREALEKLCLNLLDNAIKYNRPGGRVRVRLFAEGEAQVLEVADTGQGIPEAAIPRVFERFYRVDRGRSREEGGTGLGLAIVKHAALRHGGRVEVESRLEQGSTFRVRLPLRREAPGR